MKIIFYYVTSLLLRLLLRDEKARKPEASVVSTLARTITSECEKITKIVEKHGIEVKTVNAGRN